MTSHLTSPAETVIELVADDHRKNARLNLRSGTLAARQVALRGCEADVAVFAGGAMLHGDDRVQLTLRIGSGCSLTLVDIGALVAYPNSPDESSFEVSITLAKDAQLRWQSQPLVIAEQARVFRKTQVVMSSGARLTMREAIVFGRSRETGGELRSVTTVADSSGPLYLDELSASGARPVAGITGAKRVIETFLSFASDQPVPSPAAEFPSATWMQAHRGGWIGRWLGDATHESPFVQHASTA